MTSCRGSLICVDDRRQPFQRLSWCRRHRRLLRCRGDIPVL